MKWKTIGMGTALVAVIWGWLSWNSFVPHANEAKAHNHKKQNHANCNKAKPKAHKACCRKHKKQANTHHNKAKPKARKACCHKHKKQAMKAKGTLAVSSKKSGAQPSSKSLSLYQLKSTWKSHQGKTLKLSSLRGSVILLAMIYASCPHACPMTISDIQAIDRGLTPEQRKKVRIVLVTFDPKRDTATRLRALAQQRKMDSRWLLLRGSSIQILELAAVLGVKYRKINDVDYVHSNLISILDQRGVRRHQQVGLAQKPQRSQAVIRQLLSK